MAWAHLAPDILAMDILAEIFCLLGCFGTCRFYHCEHFDMWTLWHRDILAQGYFSMVDVLARGRFGTVDVSAYRCFGT